MIKSFIFKIAVFSLFLLIFQIGKSEIFAQASLNAFAVQESDLLEKMSEKKQGNPKLATAEMVAFANELLSQKGLNYEISFDTKLCQSIEEVRKKQKPEASKPVRLTARLNQEQGEPVSVSLPEARTPNGTCGSCFLRLPVLSLVEKDFVTIIQGRNIKFLRPSNFLFNEVLLVTNNDLAKVIRRWAVPFQATPVGISKEGEILYLNLPNFNDLAIAVFPSGLIQFTAKSDLVKDEKGILLKDFPKDANNPNLSFIAFGNGSEKRTLKFNAPCN